MWYNVVFLRVIWRGWRPTWSNWQLNEKHSVHINNDGEELSVSERLDMSLHVGSSVKKREQKFVPNLLCDMLLNFVMPPGFGARLRSGPLWR